MIFARFLPRTLFWRLVWISLGGLLFLRITIIPMENYSKNQTVFRTVASVASRMLTVYMHVITIAPEHIAQCSLSNVQDDNAHFSIKISPRDPGVTDGTSTFSRILKPQLEQALTQASVAFSHLTVRFQMISQGSDDTLDWQTEDSLFEQFRTHTYLRIEAAFQMPDETWVSFFHSVNISQQNSYWLEATSVVLEFLLVMGCMGLLLRYSLQPLHQLVIAAECFGKNRQVELLDTNKGSVEIREATEVFNRMVQSIRQTFDERERILMSFSHDLRTPLTRLRLRLEQVEQDELREKLCVDVDDLKDTLNSTIEYLRSTRTRDDESVSVPVMPLLKELVACRQSIGEQVTLSGTTDAVLNAPPLRIKSCIENIVDNALRYGICATIFVHEEQTDTARQLFIDVTDCGPGIPRRWFKQVFEPYVRLETSRNQDTGGYGLGLSIARNNARSNGGDVTLSNLPAGGLRVRISFAVS